MFIWFQVLGEELRYSGIEPLRDDRVGHHVGESRKRQEVVRLTGAEQGVAELHAMEEVDIVVGRAVDD